MTPSIGSRLRVGAALLPPLALALLVAACDPGGGAGTVAGAAPDSFTVRFETSAGTFDVRFRRAWSPLGVDRVHALAGEGFFEGARFFRVNPRVVQFGYSGRPAADSTWRSRPIADEPVRASNVRGAVSFARAGPDTRDFQLFINRVDNPAYDSCCNGGFPPVGTVIAGMEVVDALHAGYGEPDPEAQDRIMREGNAYLRERYPLLDSVLSVRIVR